MIELHLWAERRRAALGNGPSLPFELAARGARFEFGEPGDRRTA